MREVQSQLLIDRPPQAVFAYLCDLGHDAEWRREWIETRLITPGPIGVGSRFRLVGKALGRRMEAVYETTEYDPNQSAAWQTVSGPMALRFRRSIAPKGKGTLVTFTYSIDRQGPILRALGPLFAIMGRRQLEGDYPELLHRLT